MDGGEAAVTAAPLREQTEHAAPRDHRRALAQRLTVDAATVHRELRDQAEDPAERPDEQLHLGHERHRPPDRAGEQDRVHVAAVVGPQDHRTGRRDVLRALDADAEPEPHQRLHHHSHRPVGAVGERPAHRARLARAASTRRTTSATTSFTGRSVESITTASSLARVGDTTRLESRWSRRATSSADSTGLPALPRRRARSAGEAVRNTFTSAAGHTTVPMSRPSATPPPFCMTERWSATSRRRTAGTAETAETAALTSLERSS